MNRIYESLYEETVSLPIIDYHNHLNVSDIEKDVEFENITTLWLKPDPYKHRIMRINGVPEYFITGGASDREKFIKWCTVFPNCIGTPVYDWSLSELDTLFGIKLTPCAENAEKLWDEIGEKMESELWTPTTLTKKFNVEYSAPCVALCDDISFFEKSEIYSPSLRCDDIIKCSAEFLQRLEKTTGSKVCTLDDMISAVGKRLDNFIGAGCRFCDIAVDDGFEFYEDDKKNNERFLKTLNNEITNEERTVLTSYIMTKLGALFAEKKLIMQLHAGALRSTSTALRNEVGAAGGYAGIGNISINQITRFLDSVEKEVGFLPKTILFTLNPALNASIAVLSGSYARENCKGVVCQGPAWWWCDHIQGMREVFDDIMSYGLLSTFPGMTTDSRSFLSYIRHNYFRKTLCSWICDKVVCGQLPKNIKELKKLTEKMAYRNSKEILKNGF